MLPAPGLSSNCQFPRTMSTEYLVYVIDDDDAVRDAILELLDSVDIKAVGLSSADAFIRMFSMDMAGCIVLDIRMPGMSGLALQKRLAEMGSKLPIVFVTGHGDVPMAVEAIKRGAHDFLQKPFRDQELLECIQAAMSSSRLEHEENARQHQVQELLDSLTAREKEVLGVLSEGHPNKVIADRLGISQRTVENHRARLLEKLGVKSTAGLIKLMMDAVADG